jgi:hypothetical protein
MTTAVSPKQAPFLKTLTTSLTSRTIYFATNVASLAVMAFAGYVVTLFAAGWMMPRLGVAVALGMGIDLDTASTGGYALWQVSALVGALLLAALAAVSLRGLWRVYRRKMAQLKSHLGLAA